MGMGPPTRAAADDWGQRRAARAVEKQELKPREGPPSRSSSWNQFAFGTEHGSPSPSAPMPPSLFPLHTSFLSQAWLPL